MSSNPLETGALAVFAAVSIPLLLGEVRSVLMLVLRASLRRTATVEGGDDRRLPTVAVQLPLFREQRVIRRLLEGVLAMDYPADLLEVQILDDTPEEERPDCERITESLRALHPNIRYLPRSDRTGFKAGALNHGLRHTSAELLAVFDADFIPSPNFLKALVPYFDDPRMGCVQARWGYLNAEKVPLTLLQAAVFDIMFAYENEVKARLNSPALFLGTAGVWRRRTIEIIGGWRERPFTSEDIDMSCRAYSHGWMIGYADQPLARSELVESFLAYKGQQRRWARGVLRSFLDNAVLILRAPFGLPAAILALSLFFLQFSVALLPMVAVTMLVAIAAGVPRTGAWYGLVAALTIAIASSPTLVKAALSQLTLYSNGNHRLRLLLRGAPLTFGLSVSIGLGFIDTLRSSNQVFNRTSKSADLAARGGPLPIVGAMSSAKIELALALISTGALVAALDRRYFETLPLCVIFVHGFSCSALASWRELALQRRTSAAA